MINLKYKHILICLIGVLSNLMIAYGQDVPANKEEARKLKDSQRYEEAFQVYSTLIEQNNSDFDCYLERAFCLEKMNRYEEAINDYRSALNIKPGEIDLYRKALIDYLLIENYNQATEMFSTMVQIKNKTIETYQKMAIDKIKLGEYDEAIKEINTALDYDNTNDYSHFIKGVVMDSTRNTQVAIQSYLKAISCMYLSKEYKEAKDKMAYKPYFINLAVAQRKTGSYEESLKNLNTALSYDNNDDNIYTQRAITYSAKNDFLNAEENFVKAFQINEKNSLAYFERGLMYKKQEKYPDAIGDFTNAILFRDKFPEAHYYRALCYQSLNKFKEAEEEFILAKKEGFNKKSIESALGICKEKAYEYYKESNNPQIEFAYNNDKEGKKVIRVPKNKQIGTIKGKISDESNIKSIVIDGVPANFKEDDNNPSFSAQIPVENKDKVTISVTDVYFNTTTETYELLRTESTPPKIEVISPFITFDKEILPENSNINNLYVEGKIDDESLVESIIINGQMATFSSENTNPTFSLNINIEKTDSLVIEASDIYDNRKRIAYYINRVLAEEEQKNPMGRTWVVFIENSNYQSLPSLEGSKKDIITMKSALANYNISKIIHKPNMTKAQMDRFFSIELRDQINKGNVQSLLVWFAGHGRYLNETGYWLPTDASKTDEYTYFPITSLKGYLSLYKLRHTLVISDACETGPAFYLAMRGETQPKDCNDWESTKLKSAQVFTSTDREKASDNSIFTKTFATILNNTPDKCISIDKITEKVISAVEQNQKQKPKFGNISGLEDQNGTFFFIKK
ncbi:MAG: tetratricopeptide repeat protein [Bacteroidia bacterium]|nr:tetratricopeptide repeat protein [Bacteroidia bacterium]